MKVLVLGGNGMLGSQIVKDFNRHFEVYTIGRTKCINSINHIDIDINNSRVFSNFLKDNFFHIIINSAAIVDHNICESKPEDCLKINSLTNKIILENSPDDTKIIFISSDAVFADFTTERLPNSVPTAQSMYGRSKVLGEKLLINSGKSRKYLIIRTTILGFNNNEKGFIEWIVKSLKNKKEITLFNDVVFNPISIYRLTSIILKLILSNRIGRDILHLNSPEKTTKYDFGYLIAKNLNLDTKLIIKGSLNDYSYKGNRCFNQFLDTKGNKYREIDLPTISQTINELIKNFRNDTNKV